MVNVGDYVLDILSCIFEVIFEMMYWFYWLMLWSYWLIDWLIEIVGMIVRVFIKFVNYVKIFFVGEWGSGVRSRNVICFFFLIVFFLEVVGDIWGFVFNVVIMFCWLCYCWEFCFEVFCEKYCNLFRFISLMLVFFYLESFLIWIVVIDLMLFKDVIDLFIWRKFSC